MGSLGRSGHKATGALGAHLRQRRVENEKGDVRVPEAVGHLHGRAAVVCIQGHPGKCSVCALSVRAELVLRSVGRTVRGPWASDHLLDAYADVCLSGVC